MLTELLQKKLSGNFIFDGILLMFINFVLMFAFGVIFGLLLLLQIFIARYGWQMPFNIFSVIVLFALISIYIWFVFGGQLAQVLSTNKFLKILIISLIGSAPILLVFIYVNLLIGLEDARQGGVLQGLMVFSVIVVASLFFEFVALVGGVGWEKK